MTGIDLGCVSLSCALLADLDDGRGGALFFFVLALAGHVAELNKIDLKLEFFTSVI